MSIYAAIAAAALNLHAPLNCTLGKNCFIQNYVDQDAGISSWRDFTCGPLSYDGHKGTDFRLKNTKQMEKGVKVLAIADGKVLGLRAGMADISIKDPNFNKASTADRECGNGVLLEHEGYVTQYCHLKNGSLKVKQGDEVKAGQVLGKVGLSGQTEFPHVHVEVRSKSGRIIDPFQPEARAGSCGQAQGNSWWSKKSGVTYTATGLLQSGWVHTPPTVEEARAGRLDGMVISSSSPAMIFWAELFGLRDGDELLLRVENPKSQELAKHSQIIKGNKAVYFQFLGKKLTMQRWQSGDYRATIEVLREGKPVLTKHSTYSLP